MVRARRELERRGAAWQEVARNPGRPWKPAVLQLAGALPEGGTLALVPAYHARLTGYLDLPGALLISIPAESGAAEARARTDLSRPPTQGHVQAMLAGQEEEEEGRPRRPDPVGGRRDPRRPDPAATDRAG